MSKSAQQADTNPSSTDRLALQHALVDKITKTFGCCNFTHGESLLSKYFAEYGADETYWGFCSELAIERTDFEAAHNYNEKIFENYPEDFWSLFRTAKIAARTGDIAGALKSIQAAEKVNPGYAATQSFKAKLLLREGNVIEALGTLEASFQANPTDIWLLIDLIEIYDAQGRYAEALALLDNCYGRMSKKSKKIISKRRASISRNWKFEGQIRRNFDKIYGVLGGSVIVDVGAAGGLFWKWEILSRMGVVKGIGFEPDADECRASQALFPHNTFLQMAIAGKKGKTKLRIARNGPCTSLLEPNLKRMQRWPIRNCFETIKTIEISAVTLSQALSDAGIDKVDFLKVDVQGAEGEVLAGAGKYLDQLLGIELETHMVPLYKGERVFADLTGALDKWNFRLRGVEPQGSFEGEVVEIEAFYGRDTVGLSDLELRKLFLWEALSDCPQLPFMGDNKALSSYPDLEAGMTEHDYRAAKLRRKTRKWVNPKSF